MLFLIMVLMVLISFIFETSIFPYLSFLDVVPSMGLLVVMFMGVYKGKVYGSIMGIVIGLIQDVLFSPIIGTNALILFFAGYFIGKLEDKIIKDNIFIPIILSVIGTIYFNFFYYIFMFFLSSNVPFLSYQEYKLVVEIIYNIIIAIPLYKIFAKIFAVPTLTFVGKQR